MEIKKTLIQEMEFHTVVVGTGAAGFNAASRLKQYGVNDIAIIAEQVNAGTSRNTGSDKQTYYKLSLAGKDEDSVLNLAEDLFAGQCVDGDVALCEAALSTLSFYRLVELGVPFPCTEFGEYVGYKTDHDRGRRATSVGPYTSKIMTQQLEKDVRSRQIEILDRLQVIHIMVEENEVCGVLCLDLKSKDELHYVIIWCQNIVYATGGPAGMYHDSVYPESQLGSSGIAFAAGVRGKNLTEWQFGMASLQPRWNVSGTYMQVLPRLVSTDSDGNDEREFLLDYFDSTEEMLSLLFLKGYQWPFDTNKIFGGSSIIDLLVYQETIIKKRRVFLDYRKNPGDQEIVFEKLSSEAYEYLKNADACFGTPIQRLEQMNELAIHFYQEHGVDLYQDKLEIAICAQHNNGGLAVDHHWQTNVKGFFAVGEVAGTHGVTRPGGSALNAGQVGSTRAAEYIAHNKNISTGRMHDSMKNACRERADQVIQLLAGANHGTKNLSEAWKEATRRMSQCGGMIRNKEEVKKALDETEYVLINYLQYVSVTNIGQASLFYHLYDTLLAQKVYLTSMYDYLMRKGGSRGSALYTSKTGKKPGEKMPDLFTCQLDQGKFGKVVQEIYMKDDVCVCEWRPVRDIPDVDYFFETQWKHYRERMETI